MPGKIKKNLATASSQVPSKISSVEEEKFMAIMRQVGETSMSNLSPEHITEVLSQRRKIGEYIHEENMQEHERFKILQNHSLIQLAGLLIFATAILILVAVVDKSLLPEALTLIIGFIGGYGVGKTQKEPPSKKE